MRLSVRCFGRRWTLFPAAAFASWAFNSLEFPVSGFCLRFPCHRFRDPPDLKVEAFVQTTSQNERSRKNAMRHLIAAISLTALTVTGCSERTAETPESQKRVEAAARRQARANLKQLRLANEQYHDENGRFPSAASEFERNGLSYVHLLPFLETQHFRRPSFTAGEVNGNGSIRKRSRSRMSAYLCPSDPTP